MKRAIQILTVLALVAAALVTALTLPASAEKRNVGVRMSDGTVQYFVVDAPSGATLQDLRALVPGVPVSSAPIQQVAPPKQAAPAPAAAPTAPQQAPTTPSAPPAAPPPPKDKAKPEDDYGKVQQGGETRGKRNPGPKPKAQPKTEALLKAQVQVKAKPRLRPRPRRAPARTRLRQPDGAPTSTNPGFVDALPGPSTAQGVPNFVIRKFRVPVFLLPIYQAAGIQYGVH